MSGKIDLYNNKYDRQTLKDNIYALKLIDILKTQILDETFIVRYILNSNYRLHEDDDKINLDVVLELQPHISEKMIAKEFLNYNSDDDSVTDFESFSKKN
jgi:hypothetical protein